jgi:hypothetical protein
MIDTSIAALMRGVAGADSSQAGIMKMTTAKVKAYAFHQPHLARFTLVRNSR